MTALFVDTGPFVARVLPRDQYHRAALRAWGTLEDIDLKLFTSEHVFDEAVTLLGRQAGTSYAARWAREILASQELAWLEPTREEFHEALRWMETFADHKLSFTDCLSFALMRRQAILTAFSFDQHFSMAGFELWPQL